ncbi:MAG TPA: hypothetical protein VFD58_18150 [Blastocatellia bacterium]|nr:hypothetical protein [Blastocatellia bacterium]
MAGNGTLSPGLVVNGDGGQATQASLQYLRSLVAGSNGDLYFLEGFTHLRRVAGDTGILSTIAMVGNVFHPAQDLTLDAQGNFIVSGGGENRLFKVSPTGAVSTFAGTTATQFGAGGPALLARLNNPRGITTDASGSIIFADSYQGHVRKITPDGIINTVAGSGETSGLSGDSGPATAAKIFANDVAVDDKGSLYITGGYRVRKVSPDGIINTIAGNDSGFYNGDGQVATSASVAADGIAVDKAGNIYIAEPSNHRIRRLMPLSIADSTPPVVTITAPTSGPTWTTLGGTIYLSGTATDNALLTQVVWQNDRGGSGLFSGTLSAWATNITLQPGLNNLTVTAWDVAGNKGSATLAVTYNARADFSTAAGSPVVISATPSSISGGFSGDGGAAAAARLDNPRAVASDRAGNLYVADTVNQRIRKIAPDGIITTFAGSGLIGSEGDGGPATAASLNEPQGLAVDAAGNVYIADTLNHRVRRVTPAGVISTFAGTGAEGFSGDGGAAASALLSSPLGLAMDGAGDLYIADSGNHRVRKVTISSGVITTVAGGGYGFGGNNGPATEALFKFPSSLVFDQNGNLYIADTGNYVIRKVTPSGLITTAAGTGQSGFSGDGGAATAARISEVGGPAVDGQGNLYASDRYNQRVRRITTAGMIMTLAGNGTSRFDDFGAAAGDALAAQLNGPTGLAVDPTGRLYIADTGNHRVLAVNVLRETPALASVSAASYFGTVAAPESIMAAFGPNLTSRTEVAQTLPLPFELADVSVYVRGFSGPARPSPLFFASPGQINFQIPAETPPGLAFVTVYNRIGEVATGSILITTSAPGLFAANSDGQGAAAALVLRVRADGSQNYEPAAQFDSAQKRFVTRPIDLGPDTDHLFLVLFGTGIRYRNPQSPVTAKIGEVDVEVLYAGAQGGYAGLDQINLRLPRSLGGRGAVDVVVAVGGRSANTVKVSIK